MHIRTASWLPSMLTCKAQHILSPFDRAILFISPPPPPAGAPHGSMLHHTDLFILRGIPGHIRSDNGPEFVAEAVQEWIAAVGTKTAYIERGSPWENGYIESFNARLRDELLNGEIFYTLREAQIVIESWRRHYNTIRPHASIGYKPPAPEVFVPAFDAWPAALRRAAQQATLAKRPTLN
jgi:putative transposase